MNRWFSKSSELDDHFNYSELRKMESVTGGGIVIFLHRRMELLLLLRADEPLSGMSNMTVMQKFSV